MLLVSAVVCLCAPMQAEAGLVGHWRLGDTAGTTAVETVRGLNGTYLNGTAQGVAGLLDSADGRPGSMPGTTA
jgi:hypothetical protein